MEVIRIGSRGDAVRSLQTLLKQWGYNVVVDGIFGSGTENIVESFQEKNHLNVDGVVGKSTWNILLGNGSIEHRINDTKYVLTTKNYYNTPYAKNAIVLHHTNGWVVKRGKPSMNHFHWWTSGDLHVSTAFSIDYEGNIYQHFDPSMWAWHLGLGSKYKHMDQLSIGIEITNEGGMTKDANDKYYWHSGDLALEYNRPNDEPVYVKNGWRGYNYFAPYSDKQVDATLWLVKYLIKKFGIKMNFISDCEYHPEILGGFEGIYNHSNVRDYPSNKPKWDLSPAFPFKDFERRLLK